MLAASALVACPILVKLHPMAAVFGFDTWDAYDTWAECERGERGPCAPASALNVRYLPWSISCRCRSRNSLALLLAPRADVLTTPPLRFLGEISYSIYCFHAPVIFLSGERQAADQPTLASPSPHWHALAAWAIAGKGVNYDALPLVTAGLLLFSTVGYSAAASCYNYRRDSCALQHREAITHSPKWRGLLLL